MSESIDPFVREAVQAKVQQEIEERVYHKLRGELRRWKFLGYGGGSVVALLVFLVTSYHQAIFALIVDKGGDSFRQTIEDTVQRHKETIRTSSTEANVRIDMAREELGRLSSKAIDARDKVLQHIAEIDAQNRKLEALIAQQKDLERSLVTAQESLATAQEATKIALSRYSEAARSRDERDNKEPSPPTLKARSTVYFQFAGFERGVAERISKAISELGWQIPGQERTGAAANQNVIRFNPADEKLAQQLQSDANAALKALNLPNALRLEPNNRIRVGIPEIWISQ